MTATVLTVTLVTVSLLLNALPLYAVQCVKRDGELVLRDNGKDVPPRPFDCLRMQGKKNKVPEVTFLNDTKDGSKCSVKFNKPKKASTSYAKSEMPTGTYCKYKCVEASGYSCLYTPKSSGKCACEPAKPRVVTVAVVGGKGPDALGETCDDKWEGYEFADAVACTRIQGEFKKEQLVETEPGKCTLKVETLFETKYMRTEKVDRNLQGCVYVCKKDMIKCLGKMKRKSCKCGRKGLRKVLIGMNELQVQGRVDQTKCMGGDCGPCGVCIDGECVLKKGASKGNNCECGEICPAVDRRTGNRGGKIFCEPNWRLGCRALPTWMQETKPGTTEPDLCTPGRVDAGDTCGCAEGYKEVLTRFGKTKCRIRYGEE